LEGIIDRLHRANAKLIDPDLLAKARGWLHGYMCKLATREVLRIGKPHPPDDKIVAQFLAMGDGAGGWGRLEIMLQDLLAERREAYSYAWFVSVAAQRLHGISAEQLKQRRAELRVVRDRARGEASAEVDQLHRAVATAAARKRFR